MATLQDTTNLNTRTLSTSVPSQLPKSVSSATTQQTKVIDQTANDINKLFGGSEKGTKATYKASEFASKLVANDTYTNFANGISAINRHYEDIEKSGRALTSKDYAEMRDWKQNYLAEFNKTAYTDDEKHNLIVKEGFTKPAVELAQKEFTRDNTMFLAKLKEETITNSEEHLKTMGTNITQNDVQVQIATLDKVGDNQAHKRVWYGVADNLNAKWKEVTFNGIQSPFWEPYLEKLKSGKYNSIDEMFRDGYNSIYGKFVQHNGKDFSPVNDSIDTTAYQSMVKSYKTFITAMKGSGGENVYPTVDTTNSKLTMDNSMEDYTTALNASKKQVDQLYVQVKAGNKSAISKFPAQYKAYQDIALKSKKKSILESTYLNYYDGNGSIPTESHTETVMVYNPNGYTQTPMNVTVTPEESIGYINKKLAQEYNNAIQKGDKAKAKQIAARIATSPVSGYSNSAFNSMSHEIKSTEMIGRSINKTTNITQLVSTLDGYETFKNVGQVDAPTITTKKINSIKNYYQDRLNYFKLQGSKDPEGDAFRATKLYANVELTSMPLSESKDTKKIAGVLGVKPSEVNSDDGIDSIVVGYVAGHGTAARGSSGVLLDMATENGFAYNKDSFVPYAKTKTFVVDESHLPFVGEQIVAVKPDGLKPDDAANRLTSILKTRLASDKGSALLIDQIDFKDLVDEGNSVQLEQHRVYVQGKKELVTIVHIYDKNMMENVSYLITEDEWVNHIVTPSEKKKKSNRKYR